MEFSDFCCIMMTTNKGEGKGRHRLIGFGRFGNFISRLFRHTILPSVAESANWPRGFVPDRHSSSTDVGWWHRPAGRLRRSTFHSHHLHPSTPHVKNGCFRCYHPLPQGPSARSAANRRLASRSPVASRGSRGNSIRARVPEKKALSAPIAPGDGPDGAMRGPANRTIQLCGRSLTSSHLLFPPQVEFRGQTAGLKRGKAVKVRAIADASLHVRFPLPLHLSLGFTPF